MKKGRRPDGSISWLIFDGNTLMLEPSEFLELKGLNSEKTSMTYGEALIFFFRYLSKFDKNYLVASTKDIADFILYLNYVGDDGIKHIDPQRRKNTVKQYYIIVREFYRWLKESMQSEIPILQQPAEFKRVNPNSFLYGQIYQTEEYVVFERSIEKALKKLKNRPSTKHKRWYTEVEIELFAGGFKKRRDRVIFLISVKLGPRINEILAIREEDYDSTNQSLYIRESKSKDRYLYVPKWLCDEIDKYIQTERRDVESDIGLLDYLFVNMRKGPSYGKRLDTKNALRIFKRTAEKVGFDPAEIITHAGRSTRVQQLLEQQALDPGSKISDANFMEIFGWANINPITSYKKHSNLKIQKSIVEKNEQRTRLPRSGAINESER